MESATAQHDQWLPPKPAEHGWLESLIIWCSENNISLHGSPPLLGGAQHDVAITALAPRDVDRSMFRQLARFSHQYWASDFLLLDGSTVNTNAVHYTGTSFACFGFSASPAHPGFCNYKMSLCMPEQRTCLHQT